ncbi:hypothetical protein H311_05237, partial [Anncaliia algerae PRA109]
VKKGSVINSDCWRTYDNIESGSYIHITVYHINSYINYDNGVHNN